MRCLATSLALALGVAAEAAAADPPSLLEAAGWRHGTWQGIAPATWRVLPGGGVAVEGLAQGSFVWRPVAGPPGCLGWRWRVAEGPPPMDLTRRGTDRALSVAVGFAGFPPNASALMRSRHAVAQAAAGGKTLPRSVLVYVWGGTGREPGIFASPYAHGLAKIRILRTADASRGDWAEERVDLAADWRAAFGGDPPPVTEIAVTTDVDDSRSRVNAAVANIGPVACR
jgi:hypothetical protein